MADSCVCLWCTVGAGQAPASLTTTAFVALMMLAYPLLLGLFISGRRHHYS